MTQHRQREHAQIFARHMIAAGHQRTGFRGEAQ